MQAALELVFETRIDDAPSGISKDFWRELSGRQPRIVVSDSILILDAGSSAGAQFVFDLKARTRMHVDRLHNKAVLGEDISFENAKSSLTLLDQRRVASGAESTGRDPTHLHRYRAEGFYVDCWSRHDVRAAAGLRKLWALLLPHVATPERPDGVPLRIQVETPPGRVVASLALSDVLEVDPEQVHRDVAKVPIEPLRKSTRKVPQKRQQRKAGIEVRPSVRTDAQVRAGSQATEATDFMWLQKSAALAQVQSLINALARPFYQFTHVAHVGTLRLDWWDQLRPYINCDPHEPGSDTEKFLLWLRKIWLMKKVVLREELGSLSDQERTAYALILDHIDRNNPLFPAGLPDHVYALGDQILACNAAGLPVELTRYILICGFDNFTSTGRNTLSGMGISVTASPLLSAGRLTNVENAEFDDLTRWRAIPMPEPIEKTAPLARTSTKYRIFDFEPTVSIEHQPLLTRLEYHGDHIEAELALKQLYVSFNFATWPEATATNVAIGILSGGLVTASQLNAGWGYFNADDARIVVTLRSRTPLDVSDPNPPMSLTVAIDPAKSRIDTSVAVFGSNLGLDILTEIGLVAASLFDLFNASVLGKLNELLQGAFSDKLFQWPTMWHPLIGPSGHAQKIDLGKGIWFGSLPWFNVFRSLKFPKRLDPGLVNTFGIAVTDDYLTNWLRAQLAAGGEMAAQRDVDIDWAAAGLTLPDPASAPVPSQPQQAPVRWRPYFFNDMFLPDYPPPAVPAPQRAFRTRLTRYMPVIDLGADGAIRQAGTMRMSYALSLDLVSITYSAARRPPAAIPHPYASSSGSGGSAPRGEYQALARRRISRDAEYSESESSRRMEPGSHDFDRDRFQRPEQILPPRVTPPPPCLWDFIPSEQTLLQLVRASVEVTARMYLGFDDHGELWLARIVFSVQNSAGVPTVSGALRSVQSDPSLGTLDQAVLGPAAVAQCVSDAQNVLKRAIRSPYKTRTLVPLTAQLGLNLPDTISDVFKFRQDSPDQDFFYYQVFSNVLHWPLAADERLSGYIVTI